VTTTIVYAGTADGDLVSQHASYSTARAGGTITAGTTAGTMRWGQTYTGGVYSVFQAFLSFAYTPDTAEVVTSAYVRVRATGDATSTAVTRSLVWAEYDWDTTVTSGDWRTAAQVAALPVLATVTNAEDATDRYLMAGSDSLVTRLESAGPLRLLGMSDRARAGSAPSGEERASFVSADASGTVDDPALVFTSAPACRLFGVLGAQAQLSDGTHVYLKNTSEAPTPVVELCHHNGSVETSIATVRVDVGGGTYPFEIGPGAQSFALCVDSSYHLFVVGPSQASTAVLAAVMFTKGSGYTWTQRATRTAALPSYPDGALNNFAAAWHGTGGDGTLMVVASRTAGRAPNTTGDIVYGLVNCNHLWTGAGSMLLASGTARGVLVSGASVSSRYTDYVNEVGTGLDVAAAPGTTNRGHVVSLRGAAQPGERATVSVWRYVLAPGGTAVADSDSYGGGYATKDAAGKVRVVPLDGTSFAVVTVDSASSAGPTVDVVQNFGTSGTFTVLGTVQLEAESIASLPPAAALSVSAAWDAACDLSGDTLWFYYFDTADDQRLMRTGVNLSTYLADRTEVQVSAAVGASGSTNHAIRVHRGATAGQQALVSVANETSGGDHSTVLVVDAANAAPSAPTLTARANFDADSAATLAWTFNDPGDTQSAFQVQVIEVGVGGVYDSTKTTSGTASHVLSGGTLDNDKSYQWRARTWDSSDNVGPWSGYGTFSTSDAGTVTVTDPVSDNPAGVITDDYEVAWSVADTTQAAYRVVLVRTDPGATVSTTGWVASVATSHVVTGMVTDVEHRVEVTVRNGAAVETGTGTRLITPSYGSPEVPLLSVTPVPDGGYMLLSVTNPAPAGDRPEVSYNEVWRALSGSAVFERIADGVAPDGTYRDYTAASGVAYDYKAVGVV